jgi:hypothetical protein
MTHSTRKPFAATLGLFAAVFSLVAVSRANASVLTLGSSNTSNATTTLTGDPGANPELKIVNTDPGGPALAASNPSGYPAASFSVANTSISPFTVNSRSKVVSLNADYLDGLDSTRLWQLGGNAATSATDFLGTTDFRSLTLKANGEHVFRAQPTSDATYTSDTPNLIGGSPGNYASSSVIMGIPFTVIGATIAGGGQVESSSTSSTKAPNVVTDNFGTVGGGAGNRAGDNAGNFSDAALATVGGGLNNSAGRLATVSGGDANSAAGFAGTVGGGVLNSAKGSYSTVPGGWGDIASGQGSFAAGASAMANYDRSFVWGDGNYSGGFIQSPAPYSFTAHATGGIYFRTNASGAATGCSISSGGGSWSCTSDRAAKRDFASVNRARLLKRLARVPVSSWSYRTERGVRHIGPTAQDFARAFNVGADDKSIAMVDADGVSLAAIQGLYRQNQALGRAVTGLMRQNHRLSARLARLELAVAIRREEPSRTNGRSQER